jgi:hypothetical protein
MAFNEDYIVGAKKKSGEHQSLSEFKERMESLSILREDFIRDRRYTGPGKVELAVQWPMGPAQSTSGQKSVLRNNEDEASA